MAVPPKNSVLLILQGLTRRIILGENCYPAGMKTLEDMVWNACRVVGTIGQLLRYAATFLRALLLPKALLAAKLLAAESHLVVCKHRIHQKKDPRPRFTAAFRVLWVVVSKCLAS